MREISQEFKTDLRFQAIAMEALQESAEAMLVGLFEDAQLAAIHRRVVTVKDRDIRFVRQLQARGARVA